MAKANIMIVEDEAIVGEELKISLEDMDYTVTSINKSGEQAIEKAEQDCPDLILMDIRLKGRMDGIEAAELIRSRLEIPVVFLTAYADDDKLERAKLTMPFGYILKPFQDRDLKVAIEMALYAAKLNADRKLAEEALQENEEKYRSLVESTEDCIYLIDKNLKYLFANDKIQSRFNLSMDKIIGRKYDDFHSKEETKNFAEKVNKVLETVQSLSYEYKSKRDNRYFIRTLSPVKEPDKKVTALTLISKDITKRKLTEESLKQANEKILREYDQRKILSKRLIDLLEKERRQIAMELHDHIGQNLTSCKIDLEIIHDRLEDSKSELRPQVKAIQEKAVQIMKDIKSISHGLRPTMIDALGIVSSFKNLFSEIKQQTGMEIRFFNRGIPKRFEEEKELAIYRITQESLTNVIRHARAKNVFVNLVKKDDNLSLSVEDDGVGFNLDKAMKTTKGKGPLGLLIMKERAIQLDGEFTIESQPGKGTHVLVEIPL